MTDEMQQHMRRMTAKMLFTMNREMRDMSMTADTALRAFMPAHRERVTRLMEMHRSMMANMKM